jgi:hypothetical protein
MEYFTYPMKTMSISQNYSQGNHLPHWKSALTKDYPIDDCGKDKNRDSCFAPVNMIIVKKYTDPWTNAIVLESIDKVITPIGKYKVYMTLTHPNDSDMAKIKVGQKIAKGKVICKEGTDGNATGNHLHITVGIAPFNKIKQNSNKKYCFVGKSVKKPEEIFYIDDDFTKIKNAGNIKWKIVPRVEYYKKYTGKSVSIVDGLHSIGVDATFKHRKVIAKANGIKLYVGTAKQNSTLLKLLKEGKLKKEG